MKKHLKRICLIAPFISAALSAHAAIYLDLEPEPLPVVDISLVFPVGFEAGVASEAGAASLLADMLESGTATKTRQEFLDALGKYGAEFDFSVSNQYSYLNISFPIVEGKNYDGLIELLREAWTSPRFTPETFELARTKLAAALKGSLDNDQALAVGTLRRWMNKKAFGGFPVFFDKLPEMKLETAKLVFERDFQKVPEMWAGVVAPASSQELISRMLKGVFSEQGNVVLGKRWLQMPPQRVAHSQVTSASRTLLLIDKADRNQSVTTLMAFSPERLNEKSELGFLFGNHVLTDGGLGSYLSEEIRGKRGLAYSVFGVARYYLGLPVLGFGLNPVREKSNEAFEVVSQMLQASYEKGTLFEELPEDFWQRQWKSFRNDKILGQSTAGERLAERMQVVTGLLSASLAESQPANWKVRRTELKKIFSDLWKQSFVVAAVVGKATEMRPLLEKNFPGFEIKVIPYQETLLSKTY